MIDLRLPYPPSTNHYWRRVGPKTLISAGGRRFRSEVVSHLAGLGISPLTGPLSVEVDVYPPDRRRRDLDNTLKALLDALTHGGVYQDDSQIDDLHVRKGPVVNGGEVRVRVRTFDGPSPGKAIPTRASNPDQTRRRRPARARSG